MLIRNEIDSDIPAIRAIVTEAMLMLPQTSGTEANITNPDITDADIVDRLRAEDALILSLVAEDGGDVVGYLAASMARIGVECDWGLIGPLAVLPSRHGEGIGSALMAEAVLRLRATCKGAALVGDPRYYGRFGFSAFSGLGVGDCPPEFVQALPFDAVDPQGELIHHPAFGLKPQG